VSHKFFQCGKHIIYRKYFKSGWDFKKRHSIVLNSLLFRRKSVAIHQIRIGLPSNFDLKNLSRFTELINLTFFLLLEQLQMFTAQVVSILLRSAHLIPRSNGNYKQIEQNYLRYIERYSNLNNNSSSPRESGRRRLLSSRIRLITEILELITSWGFSLFCCFWNNDTTEFHAVLSLRVK
jgi:hypothetical protein